jgi:hypothetical protein
MGCSDDGDIVELCQSCHKKAEARFEQFMLDPWNRSRGKPYTLKPQPSPVGWPNGKSDMQRLELKSTTQQLELDMDTQIYFAIIYNKRTKRMSFELAIGV